MEKVRTKLKSRGATGIMGMGRLFRINDDNGDKTLQESEMMKAFTEMRIGLTPVEMKMAFKEYDRD